MTEIELRQYCLEKALDHYPEDSSDVVLEAAQEFHDFLTNKVEAHLRSSL